MKIKVVIDTWQRNEAGFKKITNPSERPIKLYDVVDGEKVAVIKYGDGAEDFSFVMQDITDHSVTIQCLQPLFAMESGSGDLTKYTIEGGKETVLDTATKDFGFRFTVSLVKNGAPVEENPQVDAPVEEHPAEEPIEEFPTESPMDNFGGDEPMPMPEPVASIEPTSVEEPVTVGSEEEKKKLATSVQFNFSTGRLLTNVFNKWEVFNSVLAAGPSKFREYLVSEWNDLREDLLTDTESNVVLVDADREVGVGDFDITINKTKKSTPVFFITLPDYEYRDGTGKYVALALTEHRPRYFTLEYSENVDTHEPVWMVGELRIKDNDIQHRNIEVANNMRMTWFAGYILGLLDSENL